jgi:hypothetical protein
MIVIIAVLLGIALGVLNAKKRGGALADLLQYAAVYAIIFGLAATIVTLILDRLIL